MSRLVKLVFRQIKHHDLAVRFALQRRRELLQFLAPPPISRLAFRAHIGKPILILDRAHLSRGRARKWITRKQRQHIRLIFQQPLFCPDHKSRLLPRSQRREPQIPFEARLIGRVNSRRFINRLRLVTKRIRDPRFSIQRALKLDLVTLVRHHREEPVGIRDPKRLERLHRRFGQRQARHQHPQQQRRGGIENQSKTQSRKRSAKRREPFAPLFASAPAYRRSGRRSRRSSRSQRVFSADRLTEPQRQNPFQKPVVQQQHSEQQHQIVQKRIICRRNNRNLERRHNKKARNAKSPRQKQHPHDQQFRNQREDRRRSVKPVRQVLHVPSDPRRQRPILVVIVHRGKLSPRDVAAPDFRHARLKINPEPFPLQQEKARARWGIVRSQPRPQARRREKQRHKSRLQQHAIRLISRKIPRHAHKRNKTQETNQQ